MVNLKPVVRPLAAIAIAAATLVGPALPARAQEASRMSCDELWYARNAIYADKGYCFDTARGRATFGPGCFPPYGKLTNAESRRVKELQGWERRRRCS